MRSHPETAAPPVPPARWSVKAQAARFLRKALTAHRPGSVIANRAARPLPVGAPPHFKCWRFSKWHVLIFALWLSGSLILLPSAGSSAPGAESASASLAPSVLCLLLRLMLAQSVPAWPAIWLLPVSAPSAGLSFASSNGQPAGPKKKEPRKRLCLILILLETTASAQQRENVGAARENSNFEGWN